MRVFYFCGLRRFSVGIMVGEGRERCVGGDCSIILKFLSVGVRLGRTRAADGSRGGTTFRSAARGVGGVRRTCVAKGVDGKGIGVYSFDIQI